MNDSITSQIQKDIERMSWNDRINLAFAILKAETKLKQLDKRDKLIDKQTKQNAN